MTDYFLFQFVFIYFSPKAIPYSSIQSDIINTINKRGYTGSVKRIHYIEEMKNAFPSLSGISFPRLTSIGNCCVSLMHIQNQLVTLKVHFSEHEKCNKQQGGNYLQERKG